jgi:hydrogenase maturation factor
LHYNNNTQFVVVGLEISLDTIEECKSHEQYVLLYSGGLYCLDLSLSMQRGTPYSGGGKQVQQFIQILSSVQFLGQFILVHACSSSGVRYLSVLKPDTISLKRIMKKTTKSACWKQEEYLALSIFLS